MAPETQTSGRFRLNPRYVGMGAAAVVIAATVIVLLTRAGILFESQALLRTFMADSAGMAPSSSVRLNGILVGRIQDVMLSGSTNPGRAVEVDMVVPRGFLAKIPVDSRASITAGNLLGDKYIDIHQGSSAEHVKDGGEIASREATDIPEVFAQGSALLTQFQAFLGRLDGLLNGVGQGRGNAGMLFNDTSVGKSIAAASLEISQAVRDAKNGHGVIGHWDDLSGDMQKPMRRLDEMLADIRRMEARKPGDPAGKVPDYPGIPEKTKAAMADARATMDEAKKMLDDLNSQLRKGDEIQARLLDEVARKVGVAMDRIDAGQGTIGQLMTNPALTDSMAEVSKNFDAALKAYNANPKKFRAIRFALF